MPADSTHSAVIGARFFGMVPESSKSTDDKSEGQAPERLSIRFSAWSLDGIPLSSSILKRTSLQEKPPAPTVARAPSTFDFEVQQDFCASKSDEIEEMRIEKPPRDHHGHGEPEPSSFLELDPQREPSWAKRNLGLFHRLFERQIKQKQSGNGSQDTLTVSSAEAEDSWLHGISLALLIIGLDLVIFVISLDRTVITTAIPFITGEFHSTADIGWYGSAYLMTACGFMPMFGRMFVMFNVKWVYIFSLAGFAIGSLICALAPSSKVLIAGRAIAGIGSAGVMPGSFVIVGDGVPMRLRPIYTAAVAAMFGVGATVGPILGGIFTDLLSWRWCFWINLPILVLPLTIMLFVFKARPKNDTKRTVLDRILDLDIIGNFLLMVAVVLLFIALEEGATGEGWRSPRVVGFLCGFGILTVLFVCWQWWKQDGALIPLSMVMQRTVAASCGLGFFTYSVILIHGYFLPIWFQAVRGDSAILSGVHMIPYVISNSFMSVVAAIFVSRYGYFTPPAILGAGIGTVGCGILTLLSPDSSTGTWIGYEILISAGLGLSIQQGFTAIQTVLPLGDIGVGMAAVIASQCLGGAIFLSVGNSVFLSQARSIISEDFPGTEIEPVIQAGATAFRHLVPPEALPIVLGGVNAALRSVFAIAIPLCGLGFITASFLEWTNINEGKTTSLLLRRGGSQDGGGRSGQNVLTSR